MLRRSCVVLAGLGLGLALGPVRGWAQDARREEGEQVAPAPAPVVTKPPTLIEGVAPEYPPAARAAGKQADVTVRLHIGVDGIVTSVDVIAPVGDGFDEAAVAAVLQYRFEPAEIDGKPAPIAVETTIHFTIETAAEPDPADLPTPGIEPGTQGPPSHGGDASKPVTLLGEAVERGSRRPLAGVIVSVSQLGLDAITDEEGRFWFHGVGAGSWSILAVGDGFDRFTSDVTLEASERSRELRLWMRPRGGNPYETIVDAGREPLEVTKRTLRREQLTSVPGTFGDPIRVIQSLPGLARTPFVTGFLIVRGSNPDDSGIYVDGHRVPLIFHFLGGPSILNAEFLETIDLYPGGFPARFGRNHGGVVAVETRGPRNQKGDHGIHGAADVDLLDTSAYLRAPLGDAGAISIAGRRSYLDVMLGFFLPEPDPGDTLIVVPVYYDYQARLDWDFADEGKASVFVMGSTDTLKVVQADAGVEESLNLSSAIKFFRIIGTYKRPLGKKLTLTLSPAIGRDTVSFGSGQVDAESPFTALDIVQDTLDYRMRVEGPVHDRVRLDAGIDLESRVTHYDVLGQLDDDIRNTGNVDLDPESLSQTADVLGVALYADAAIDVTRAIRVMPGLRLDTYLIGTAQRTSLDPRLAARWAIDDHWTAKGYAGVYHQPPQPEALDSRFGNPAVGLERGLHFGAGGEWKPDRWWLFDGELYYIDRANLVTNSNDATRDPQTGEVTPLNFENSGTGNTMGFELMIKREVTRNFYGWLSYTFSRTRQLRDEESEYRPTAFDQPHTLNAVASYKTNGGWELGARFRLTSGLPRTPTDGATFDADQGDYDPLRGPSRSEREDPFHQLDVRVEKTWLFNAWSIGAYLDVQNVLDVENTEATQWDYRYRHSAPVTGVPFLPTLGIRGQW